MKEEKTRLIKSHKYTLRIYEEKLEQWDNKKEATPVKRKGQADLAQALARITTLEGEQKTQEVLEDQL